MNLNVLIVDDSAVMRKMIIQALTKSGLPLGHIFEAVNGEEGLDVVSRQEVHVVLLDVHMPVMNGEEMFRRLREDPRHASLPVVFVSSESSSTRIGAFLEQGAGFIHKPWTPEDIRAQVMHVTGGRHG